MKGRMEAGIKTIVAAGKTPSNVRNGGVTLVISRRMYAQPFHNEDKNYDLKNTPIFKQTTQERRRGRSVPVWSSKHLILLP